MHSGFIYPVLLELLNRKEFQANHYLFAFNKQHTRNASCIDKFAVNATKPLLFRPAHFKSSSLLGKIVKGLG